jgi:hypothetical protein
VKPFLIVINEQELGSAIKGSKLLPIRANIR